jgi:hypothetical protein
MPIKINARSLKAAIWVLPVLLAAVVVVRQAQAYRPTAVEIHNFGMVGITRGETARINVWNADNVTIQLSLNFTDSDGRTIGRATESLEAGHAFFLDLAFPGGDAPGRSEIHASVEAQVFSADRKTGNHVVPTLEVFDNDTGKTRMVVPTTEVSLKSS